ncbi:hypothetical protein UFOVP1439_26 [uncultured Caudovirales phage]|uniref:Uncharacterized protein n=1 Tax=uncultured Caudovirales phage TaxID=2100421 RepID=A0A6J5QSL2_9CAUD|nr:hypothetical protein UFOVP1085_6 [uncultured Caudovirales phage]CAB4212595.1 hypothetical protein UFOVP1439_26 [uncultured Caudovirales phage]
MKTIQYAIDTDTGLTWSRVGSEVAVPVLNYPADDYTLIKMSVLYSGTAALKWTRQLPVSLKNYHREFWGMNKLTGRRETTQ